MNYDLMTKHNLDPLQSSKSWKQSSKGRQCSNSECRQLLYWTLLEPTYTVLQFLLVRNWTSPVTTPAGFWPKMIVCGNEPAVSSGTNMLPSQFFFVQSKSNARRIRIAGSGEMKSLYFVGKLLHMKDRQSKFASNMQFIACTETMRYQKIYRMVSTVVISDNWLQMLWPGCSIPGASPLVAKRAR